MESIEKMGFESKSIVKENIRRLKELFPNCVKEIREEDGTLGYGVDFETLQLMLGAETDGAKEAYDFTWPGKKKSIIEADKPIPMTLRPKKDRSVWWDNTENIFIEGDNLAALKLLRESYFGKIKMIYIDPPYNTGSDLIYKDNFSTALGEYEKEIRIYDEGGRKLFRNTEANGRFHSDWCSMMYSRLMLARDLLSENGVICISMDDHEQANLMKLCDEVFGEGGRIGQVVRKTKSMTGDNGNGFNMQHEMLYLYGKGKQREILLSGEKKAFAHYANPDKDPNGDWCAGDPSARSGGPSTWFEIENPYTHRKDLPPVGRYWAFSKSTMKRYIKEGKIKFKKDYRETERGFIFKRYKKDVTSLYDPVHSLFAAENEYMNQTATMELKEIFGDSVFDYPKPVAFIKKLVKYVTGRDEIVLDFFAGSSTTAQAVMEANAEDGGRRSYIMVQLPERIDHPVFHNLCEVSQERIRRVGDRLRRTEGELDIGFRVFAVDDANERKVSYVPSEYDQSMLEGLESNIRPDRTDLDLLFGCVLEWGLPLSMPHTSRQMEGCTVHTYDGGDGDRTELMACFEEHVPMCVMEAIAREQPRRAVFRDSSFLDSAAKLNVREMFRLLAPETKVKVI